MAFSAQIDHGQNERKDAVLCEISNETSKDKGKVCACSVTFYCAPICVTGKLFCVQNCEGGIAYSRSELHRQTPRLSLLLCSAILPFCNVLLFSKRELNQIILPFSGIKTSLCRTLPPNRLYLPT